MHVDGVWDEGFVGEDDVQQEREEDDGRCHDGHDHVGGVIDELDVEGARKDQVSRVGRHEDGRGDVRNGKLRVDPGARMHDIAGHAGHIGEESRARKDDGVVAYEAAEDEEEGVQAEEESVADLAAPLEDLEGEVADEAGGVDGDGDVGERDEEGHDVNRRDVVGADGAVVDLLTADGLDGKQEEVGDERRGDEVHGEVEPHVRLDLAVVVVIVVFDDRDICALCDIGAGVAVDDGWPWRRRIPLPFGDDADCGEGIEKEVGQLPGDEYGNVKRKQDIDVCGRNSYEYTRLKHM